MKLTTLFFLGAVSSAPSIIIASPAPVHPDSRALNSTMEATELIPRGANGIFLGNNDRGMNYAWDAVKGTCTWAHLNSNVRPGSLSSLSLLAHVHVGTRTHARPNSVCQVPHIKSLVAGLVIYGLYPTERKFLIVTGHTPI